MRLRFTCILIYCFLWVPDARSAQEITSAYVKERIQNQSRLGKLARLRAAAAETEIDRAHAVLDQRVVLEGNHQIDASERVTTVFGTRNDTTNLNGRYETEFRTGTLFSFGIENQRATSNSPFATLDPAYDSAWVVGLRQRLFQGGFGSDTRNFVEAARSAATGETYRSEREIQTLTEHALLTYWNWRATMEEELIAQRAVDRARKFERITTRKSRIGTAEADDLLSAQANVAARLTDSLQTREARKVLGIDLKNMLLLEPTIELSSSESFPSEIQLPSQRPLVETALQNRADLKALQADVESRARFLRAYRSLGHPRFDLFSTLRLNAVNDGFDSALGEAFESDNPVWTIGGEIEIPFENRARRADIRRAELELEILETQRDQLKDDITAEISQVYSRLTDLQAELNLLRELKVLEEKKLQARQRDFERGRTDGLNVLLAQQDFLQADRRLILAQARVAGLFHRLESATGSLIAGKDSP